MMLSAAVQEARARGGEAFPVLAVDWEARGLSLGRGVYSTAVRTTALGQVTAVTKPGGWDSITYGSGIERGQLDVVRTSVEVSDPARELLRTLETYDPRGSAARIDWAAPGLDDVDWTPLFRGVVEDWERAGLYTKLLLKTDDTALRTAIPSRVFARTEWGSAPDSTIYGTAMPLVMGIFDSFAITARGMVPAIGIRYDKDLGYWWLASCDHLVEIRRVYYDGVAQPDTIWTTRRGVWGGGVCTIIEVTAGYQPDKGVVVSFDCEGPDEDGLYAGDAVTNPVRLLRTVLEEFAYRPPPLGAWRGDHSIVGAGWDTGEAWFEARGYECAKRFGADQNPETAAEVIASFLDAYPSARIHWSPLGALDMLILDPDDEDPAAAGWFRVDLHHEGGRVEYAPGDLKDVYSHLRMPYMWSPAEQKYLGALEAHDVAALPLKVPLEVPNNWSQGRYSLE